MSVLTIEERSLLKALGCKDKAQAVSVLDDMLPTLPMRSEMFRTALMLSYKLKNLDIDYDSEMTAESVEDNFLNTTNKK